MVKIELVQSLLNSMGQGLSLPDLRLMLRGYWTHNLYIYNMHGRPPNQAFMGRRYRPSLFEDLFHLAVSPLGFSLIQPSCRGKTDILRPPPRWRIQ